MCLIPNTLPNLVAFSLAKLSRTSVQVSPVRPGSFRDALRCWSKYVLLGAARRESGAALGVLGSASLLWEPGKQPRSFSASLRGCR